MQTATERDGYVKIIQRFHGAMEMDAVWRPGLLVRVTLYIEITGQKKLRLDTNGVTSRTPKWQRGKRSEPSLLPDADHRSLRDDLTSVGA